MLAPHQIVDAATDADGVIRVVATADYAAQKREGIAAPWPDQDAVQIPPWDGSTRVFWRASDDDEWVEVERPADGETFDVRPGEAVRVEAPRGLRMSM